MKKFIFVGILILICNYSFAQVKADTLKLDNPNSFSFALLPDVQNYVKYDYNQPVLELMTAWIADNTKNLNIKAALCTGDLVDQNECLVPPFPRFANITSKQQWNFVSKAFGRLDNIIPYIISTGNHDYGYTRSETDNTHFPEYFTVERNNKFKESLVAVCNNRHGIPTLENAAFEFNDSNWGKILIVAIEYGARDNVLEWVKNLSENEKFNEHTIIVITHSYLGAGDDAKLLGRDKYLMEPLNGGTDIWEKLLNETKNIRLLICGHYAVPNEDFASNVGFKTTKNREGKEVYQMMFNAQALGGGMSGNGGDGWLRILEFMPNGKSISVHTYSPLFGFSPKTKHLAEDKAPYNKFIFDIK